MKFRSGKSVALMATLALGLSAGHAGCGPKTASEDAIVAEVGGRPIKLREVTDFVTSLSMDFPTASDELAARQRKLDRLVEDELLVIGGYARTLDADISILEAVDAEKEKFLLDELYRAEVIDKVTVNESEVKEIFSHWFDRVRFHHIVLRDRERADSLLRALDSGADFGDLAERFSIDQASRFRFGDPGREFSYNELPIELAKVAFSLEKEQVGGPVQTDMGWHLVKVKETRKLESRDYESVRPTIEANLRRRLQQARRTAHLEELEKNASIHFDDKALALWRVKLQEIMDTTSMPRDQRPAVPAASLSQQEQDMVMYTFGSDYKVGIGEFCGALEARSPFERPDASDDAQLRRFAFQLSLFDILHEEALRRRLDESPVYKERVQNFLESLIAERMRSSVLVRGISVTESEVREFFAANPDSFVVAPTYHCREILVFTEEEANQLAEQLRGGASFEQLARAHTKRDGVKSSSGDIGWVSPSAWPDLYESASRLKPGEWAGPISGAGQYSLIQLIESRPASAKAFESVASEIFEGIQRRRRDSVFTAYIDSMKTAYPVTIDENILKSGLTGPEGQVDSGGSI